MESFSSSTCEPPRRCAPQVASDDPDMLKIVSNTESKLIQISGKWIPMKIPERLVVHSVIIGVDKSQKVKFFRVGACKGTKYACSPLPVDKKASQHLCTMFEKYPPGGETRKVEVFRVKPDLAVSTPRKHTKSVRYYLVDIDPIDKSMSISHKRDIYTLYQYRPSMQVVSLIPVTCYLIPDT